MVFGNNTNNYTLEWWIPWIIAFVVIVWVNLPVKKEIEYVHVPQYIPWPQQPESEPQQPEPEPQQPEPEPEPPKPKMCVFSLENVLDLGDPTRCVEMCKDMGCKLAIISQSGNETPESHDLVKLGMVEPHYNKEDYYYNQNAQTTNLADAANLRLTQLNQLSNKYDIAKENILYFDSNVVNINEMVENGYKTVTVGKVTPGIQEKDIKEAWEIIKSM